MKCLHIQLQPELCACDAEQIANELVTIATAAVSGSVVSVENGYDDGTYINVNVQTDSVTELWASVSARISSDPALAASAIVCCEGDSGWDHYLLLHHYDSGKPLDLL